MRLAEEPELSIRIEAVRLVRVEVPLVSPFRSSADTQTSRDVVLVELLTADGSGWGENVAGRTPTYTAEFVDASVLALRDHLLPRLLAPLSVHPAELGALLADVRGWEMAKAALETAVLDAALRAVGVSLRSALGAERTRIAPGVAVGLQPTIDATLEQIAAYLTVGYRRVKLKIEPGRDVELVGAVRDAFGDELLVQVDANAAYTLDDAGHLAELDRFELLLIEQPLAEDDLLDHAQLARQLRTPICLDEGITSLRRARDALDLGACSVVNVKPGRVGGLLEAARIHDLCLARGVPAWCGGMLETGVGRAAALALAALPGFTLPPDLSASDRYVDEDLTEPFVLDRGEIDVPDGPGIGVVPRPTRLAELGATSVEISRD